MSDEPHLTPARRAEHAARERRRAHALRDNLRRRKEQLRARSARDAGRDAPAEDKPTGDAGGDGGAPAA